MKEARGIVDGGRVKYHAWENKLLTGEVVGAGQSFFPRLNLRSLTFAENRCNCMMGRRGNVCAHAIALCLASMESKPEATSGGSESELVVEVEPEPPLKIESLVMSASKGIPARFILLLPPNLVEAAKKDRISLRVEMEMASGSRHLLQQVDRGRAYCLDETDQQLGAKIERLCGGKLHSMMQVSRAQLREMLTLVSGKGFVGWLKQPKQAMTWVDGQIPGVDRMLVESEATVEPEKVTVKSSIASRTGRRPQLAASSPSSERSKRVKVDGSPHYLAIELPSREDPSHFEVLELLKQWRFKLEPSNGKWWLRDSHHVMNFLADHWDVFKKQYQAEFSKNFESRLSQVKKLEVKVDIEPSKDGYEVNLGLSGDVSSNELNLQLAKGRRFFQKGDETLLIDKKQLQVLENLSSKLLGIKTDHQSRVGMRLNASSHDLCDWEDLLNDNGVDWAAPEDWKLRSEAIRNLSKLAEAPVELNLNDRLRLYQKIGTAWMHHLYRHQLAGILADEMGLGKTVQAIAMITALKKSENEGLALVVCPAGLVGNWLRELRQFAPQLRLYGHHGPERESTSESWDSDYDVIVTSYSTLSRDNEMFRDHEWSAIFGDEAQHIKNRRTQHAKSLKLLRGKGRFLLTGTPIENSIEDLVSLFEFLMPGYLKKAPAGTTHPDDRHWYRERIRERASHYILRRTKKQVAPELPEKLDQVIYCDMDQSQRAMYEGFRRDSSLAIEKLESSGVSEGAIKMAAFTELLRLRQICADPRLLKPELDGNLSCKLGVFKELLQESIDGGHRMLVFSQFVSVLQLLKQELQSQGIPLAYIDGKVRDRLAEADRFNNDDSIPVFLISLKAGGTGLNLTGADTVVHFDPWWNPAVEAQATDRAHRIGQTRKVTSIRLIVSGTVEEKVQMMQHKKRKELEALFDESASLTGKLELTDVKSLLAATD